MPPVQITPLVSQRILDGDGNAVQWPLDVAAGQRRIGFVRLLACSVSGQLNDSVELRIDLGDSIKVSFDDGFRSKLLGSDRRGPIRWPIVK